MTYYTVTLGLGGALAAAVAVEWTNHPAPLEGGTGWEPCLRLADGTWRFSSRDPEHAAAPHRRGPGPFSGLAIRYRLAPAGQWSAAAEPRKDIVILEMRDGEVVPVLPAVLAAPTLLGAGEIGTEITLDPGLWSGIPTPALGFQWRRDGANLPGETARAYLLGPADDRRTLSCAVTARNVAGTTVALAGPVIARHPAPRLLGALPEEIFDEGTGAQAVETAFAFAGAALAFAAEGAAVDPATGVLSIPTERPVSGAVVRVTAANSGGAVTATLRYTVEAAPARPLGAADVTVLRSVWRPEGQSRTFSPEVAFPGLAGETVDAIEFCADPLTATAPVWHPVRSKAGEPGAWQLFAANHPVPAGAPDAALFQTGDPRLAGRLRFRWREAQLRDWSEESGAFVVPVPPATPRLLPPTPSVESIAEAMSVPFTTYDANAGRGTANDSTGIKPAEDAHCPAVVALAALKGVSTTFNGRTPVQYMLAQLRHWAANRMPAGRGGFPAKFEMGFVATVATAWLIDDVRDQLTARERNRLTLAMKACLVGSAYDVSEGNSFGRQSNISRSVRGYTAWRTNPNFSLPPLIIPHIVAAFMGRESARAFMQTFDRQAFADEIAAEFPNEINASSRTYVGNARVDMWDTYRQDWTSAIQYGEPLGPGPTASQLEAALRNWKDYRHGATILDPEPAYVGQLERFFSKVIQPGLTPEPGQDPREPWGVWNSATNTWAGRIVDRTRWAGLPNQGRIGAAFELDSTDAGGVSESKKRSSMGYVHDGLSSILIALAHAAVQDVVDIRSPVFAEGRARMERGMADISYKLAGQGYQNYAKGGTGTNNDIWRWNEVRGDERLTCMHGLYYDVLLPWTAM